MYIQLLSDGRAGYDLVTFLPEGDKGKTRYLLPDNGFASDDNWRGRPQLIRLAKRLGQINAARAPLTAFAARGSYPARFPPRTREIETSGVLTIADWRPI